MLKLEPDYYKAVIKGYRNFPDITFTVTKVIPDENIKDNFKYYAISDYAFWSPGNPVNPYRRKEYGVTIEEAVRNAMNTFIGEDSDYFDNSAVFITLAAENDKTAIFINGNGEKVTYEEARRKVSENKY